MKKVTVASLVSGFFVLALCLVLPLSAFAVDKLIVKDAGGVNAVFVVTDTGAVGAGLAAPLYQFDVSSAGVLKSQMHFSTNGTDAGGWIVSASDNNFFLSSGIAFDNASGGWIQKSADGMSVIAGSSSTRGYSLFLQNGCVVGSPCPVNLKFQVAYDGNVGIGVNGPAYPIHMASGAHVTTGGVWTNASSREYKENIQKLTTSEAIETFSKLEPVKYNYKVDQNDKHVGFIAEDVPALVATQDRKGLSPMDIVAVLTKVVQEQQKTIAELNEKMSRLQKEVKLKGSFALAQ